MQPLEALIQTYNYKRINSFIEINKTQNLLAKPPACLELSLP